MVLGFSYMNPGMMDLWEPLPEFSTVCNKDTFSMVTEEYFDNLCNPGRETNHTFL